MCSGFLIIRGGLYTNPVNREKDQWSDYRVSLSTNKGIQWEDDDPRWMPFFCGWGAR